MFIVLQKGHCHLHMRISQNFRTFLKVCKYFRYDIKTFFFSVKSLKYLANSVSYLKPLIGNKHSSIELLCVTIKIFKNESNSIV